MRQFIHRKAADLSKRVLQHNLNNLQFGEDMEEFADADLGADVVDVRLDQQLKKRINEDLNKVKKGTSQYI